VLLYKKGLVDEQAAKNKAMADAYGVSNSNASGGGSDRGGLGGSIGGGATDKSVGSSGSTSSSPGRGVSGESFY